MKRPNVLLISIDTLRADHVSCYGYERETTPNIDRLAAAGTRFSRAYGTAVWTPPAHGSMLTGLYPSQHGVVDENRLDDSIPTVAEMLSADGYATVGIVNNSQVGELTALHRGHQTFHEVWKGVRSRNVLERALRLAHRKYREARGLNDHGARRTTELAKRWIEEHPSSTTPFYMFLHYIEPHNPLLAPEPFRHRFTNRAGADMDRRKVDRVAENPLVCYTDAIELTREEVEFIKGLYDGEIAYIDTLVGDLIECLKRTGCFDDTLILITADHGEHFGEHGHFSHVSSLYEPIVHVPLIVRFPDTHERIGVQDELVQHVDIVPTITDLTGAKPAHGEKLRGRSLVSSGSHSVGHVRVFAEWEGRVPFFVRKRLRGRDAAGVCVSMLQPQSMVRDDRYKFILHGTGAEELYDLEADPQENDDLAKSRPEIAQRMRGSLEEWKKTVELDAPGATRYHIDPEIKKHLESLGYM